MQMRLSAHSDVISQDFAHALKVSRDLGLQSVDLRGVWGKDIVDLSDAEVQKAKGLLREYGMAVSSLSPYLFFLPLREGEAEATHRGSYADHLAQLKRAVELAKVFETDIIKCWSFLKDSQFVKIPPYRPQPFAVRQKLIERFQQPIRIAEEAGVILAIESCHHSNTGTGIMVCKLIDELGSKQVRLLWDPCNSYFTSGEEVYPYEYEQVKDYIVGIDVKDKVIDTRTGRFDHTVMGQGNRIYWPDILRALVKDNYQGILVLESEYAPQKGTVEDGTRASLAVLRDMLSAVQ